MKHIFKAIFFIGGLIVSPFYWTYRTYKKKKTKIKYSHIVEGFMNHKFPNDKMEDLAKTRAAICSRCPFAKHSKVVKTVLVDNRTKEISGMYCDICGCSLSAKVRSKDWCPKGKW
jgi:hypothetical protein